MQTDISHKKRLGLVKRAPMKVMTMRIPVELLDDLRAIAAKKGIRYQALLRNYAAHGVREEKAGGEAHSENT